MDVEGQRGLGIKSRFFIKLMGEREKETPLHTQTDRQRNYQVPRHRYTHTHRDKELDTDTHTRTCKFCFCKNNKRIIIIIRNVRARYIALVTPNHTEPLGSARRALLPPSAPCCCTCARTYDCTAVALESGSMFQVLWSGRCPRKCYTPWSHSQAHACKHTLK